MDLKKAGLLSLFLAPVIAGVLVAIHVSILFFLPYTGEQVNFVVKPGEGFSSINHRLSKKDIVSNARIFHYYTRYQNKINRFKAGAYEIPTGVNMGEVLDILTNGKPILTKVTIPEGKNMYEVGKLLEAKGITTYEKFIKTCRDQKIIQSLGIKAPSLEGYLFPDTYLFAPGSSPRTVVATMLKLFNKKVKNLNLTKDYPKLNSHQIVILASIVEKETGAKWERPLIAGVYLNRLKKRMRLQADPTTIYGIWENYNGNLRKKHLLQKTPYNTYKINGLPLGPIANPSLAAIKAVLKPKAHNYIYFVSKNDGTHVFTPTYKEHLKAVNYWQKNRKNRKGKSWRDLKQ